MLALVLALLNLPHAVPELVAQDAPSRPPENRRYSWPEVEAALANVHAARKSNPDAYEHLSNWYNFLTDPDCTGSQSLAEHCVQLEDWGRQSPNSPTPLVVLANAEMRRAWENRGTAPDPAIGKAEKEAFQVQVRRVGELLNEAIKRGVKDGKAHTILLEVATARGLPLAEARAIMEAGARVDPQFDDLYVAMAEYLLPRWHGKEGDVERFAAEIAKRIPGEDGLAVYGHIAYFVNQYDGNLLFWGNYDRDLLVKSAEVSLKRNPQARNMVPFAALCTIAANDHAAAFRIRPFVKNNDAPRVRLWSVVSAEFLRWSSADDVISDQADCLWGAPLIHGGIEFGSDNRSIWSASGTQPTAVALYDLDSKKARIALPALRSRVHNLAFDANKNWVAATLNGEQFQGWALWDASKPNDEPISHATADACRAIAIHPHARQLAWAVGKQVHLLDVNTKREQPPIELATEARELRFSSDGRFLASIGEAVSVWEAATGRRKFDLANSNAVCEHVLHFDEEGRLWGIARARGGERTQRQLIRFSADGQAGDVLIPEISPTKGWSIGAGALSSDRRLLAVAEASDKPFGPEPITIWDVKLKRLHQRLSGHWTPIRDLAFSPDGKTIAAIGHFGGALKCWPVAEAPTP